MQSKFIMFFNIDHKNKCFLITKSVFMISEGSCDTDDQLMTAENSALPSQE